MVINLIIAALVFGLIVAIHELGHFLMAKVCGVPVLEFSLGMGPAVFSIQGKETKYSIKLLPIGGSCMMKSDYEETDDPDAFNNKPAWKRFLVVAAGPLFNFILAFLFALILVSHTGISKPVLSDVMDGYPAKEAGIKAGDTLVSIDGHKIRMYDEIQLFTALSTGDDLEVVVDRGGEKLSFHLKTKVSEEYGRPMLGIVFSGESPLPEGPFETLRDAWYMVRFNITYVVQSLKYVIRGKAGVQDMMGPVGIVDVIGETVEESRAYGTEVVLLTIVNFIVLFSANLGVMNLLPIPALDGGRLLFIILEMLLGHPVNRKFESFVHAGGFMLLMLLMVFIMFNDFLRIGRG